MSVLGVVAIILVAFGYFGAALWLSHKERDETAFMFALLVSPVALLLPIAAIVEVAS